MLLFLAFIKSTFAKFAIPVIVSISLSCISKKSKLLTSSNPDKFFSLVLLIVNFLQPLLKIIPKFESLTFSISTLFKYIQLLNYLFLIVCLTKCGMWSPPVREGA